MDVEHDGKLWTATFGRPDETVRLEDEHGSVYSLKNNVWYVNDILALRNSTFATNILDAVYKKSFAAAESKTIRRKKKDKQVNEELHEDVRLSTTVGLELDNPETPEVLSQSDEWTPKSRNKKKKNRVNLPGFSTHDKAASGEVVPGNSSMLTSPCGTTSLEVETLTQTPFPVDKAKHMSGNTKSPTEPVLHELEGELQDEPRTKQKVETVQASEIQDHEQINAHKEVHSKKARNRKSKNRDHKAEGYVVLGEYSGEAGKNLKTLHTPSPTCTEGDSSTKAYDATKSAVDVSPELDLRKCNLGKNIQMESFCNHVFEDIISNLKLDDVAKNLKINFSISDGNNIADVSVFSVEDRSTPIVFCFFSEQGKSSTLAEEPKCEPYLSYGRINLVFSYEKVGVVRQLLSRIASSHNCAEASTSSNLGKFVFTLVRSFCCAKARTLIQVFVKNSHQKSVVSFSVQFPNPTLALITCSYASEDDLSNMYDAECFDSDSFSSNSTVIITKINERCKRLIQPYVGMFMKS